MILNAHGTHSMPIENSKCGCQEIEFEYDIQFDVDEWEDDNPGVAFNINDIVISNIICYDNTWANGTEWQPIKLSSQDRKDFKVLISSLIGDTSLGDDIGEIAYKDYIEDKAAQEEWLYDAQTKGEIYELRS